MNIEEIDKWLKDEEGISYTELGNEFNDAVQLSNKCAKKIMQKDKEIEKLNNIINKAIDYISDGIYSDYGERSSNASNELLNILRGEDDEN